MPYEWTQPEALEAAMGAPDRSRGVVPSESDPVAVLRLWPHRSLPREGFAGFFALTALLALVPLGAVLGTAVLWFVLVPLVATGAATWWALSHTYRTGEVEEEMRLWPNRVTLTRRERRGQRSWEANPHWVRAAIHATGGPVPSYLTLSGAGRTVEIGAFLSEDERLALKPELERALAGLR